jgi:hypothetical protein
MPKNDGYQFTIDNHPIFVDFGMVAVLAALRKGGAPFKVCLKDGTLCTEEAFCVNGDSAPADTFFNMGGRGVRRRCGCEFDRVIPNEQLLEAFEKMRAAWAA